MSTRQVLRRKEAAEFLSISTWLLWRETKKGNIPHFKIGSLVLYRRESLETYLCQQEELATKRLIVRNPGGTGYL